MTHTAAWLSLLWLAACDDAIVDERLDTAEPSTPEDTTPVTDTGGDALSYARDVLPILEAEIWAGWGGEKASCVGCHETSYTSLTFEDGYTGLLENDRSTAEVPWVTPGDRWGSYLYLKLVDDFEIVGGFGMVMPPVEGDEMSTDDIETIGRWIDQGARP